MLVCLNVFGIEILVAIGVVSVSTSLVSWAVARALGGKIRKEGSPETKSVPED
jgi:hypothetical protein